MYSRVNILYSQIVTFFQRFDAGLSDKGVKEAENGGKALKDAGYKFDLAHTSLLTRAQTTLTKVLEGIDQTDLPVQKTWRLNERHYGGN
jgi:2,3-bisphosphoglycerate-dependent phosphoglycerate mutase